MAEDPHIECAVCWKQDGRHRLAVVALTENGFVRIQPGLKQPFQGLCRRHAEKAEKRIKKHFRRVQRFSTNLYSQEQ